MKAIIIFLLLACLLLNGCFEIPSAESEKIATISAYEDIILQCAKNFIANKIDGG